MKLLLTSDLHRDGKKLLWLMDEAPSHDALVVAGDQLEIFSNTSMNEQIQGVRRWVNIVLSSGKPFICCSGNHDFYRGESTPMKDASPEWMREASIHPNLVMDGESRLIDISGEKIVFTTIPWPVQGVNLSVDGYRTNTVEFAKRLLHAGREIREVEKVPWFVLIHEPPLGHPVAGKHTGIESEFTRYMLEMAQPDFSLHGHIHEAPDAPGGHWWTQVGQTVAFNAGQTPARQLPNAIVLDIRPNGAWNAQRIVAGQIQGDVATGTILSSSDGAAAVK